MTSFITLTSSGQVNLNSVPGTTNVGNNAAMSQQGTEEKDLDMDEEPVNSPLVEDIPEGLLRWRAAVQKSRTSSQLAVCLNFLESCIAWERSIMKAV